METNNHNQHTEEPEGQNSPPKSIKEEESKPLDHSSTQDIHDPHQEGQSLLNNQENLPVPLDHESAQQETGYSEPSDLNKQDETNYLSELHAENHKPDQTDTLVSDQLRQNDIERDAESIPETALKEDQNTENREVFDEQKLDSEDQQKVNDQVFSGDNSNEDTSALKQENYEEFKQNQNQESQVTPTQDFYEDQPLIVDETDQYDSLVANSREKDSQQEGYIEQQTGNSEINSRENQKDTFEDDKADYSSALNQNQSLNDNQTQVQDHAEVEQAYQHIYPEPNSETNLRGDAEDREEGNQEINEEVNSANNIRDPNLDNEFYQHSLQYLVQNLNSLRDTLQTILANSDLNQELRGNNQNVLADQGMNEPNEINNDDHLHDQLLNIRRILAGNIENNQNNQNDGFDWGNNWNNRFGNQDNANNLNEANRQNNWGQRIEAYSRQIYSMLPKDFNTIFWIVFAFVTLFLFYGYTTIPQKENPLYLIEWLASSKDSRLFLLAAGLFYLCATFKFNQVLYTNFISDPGENYFKSIRESFSKYSPFYDIGLYVFFDSSIVENKLERFFMASVLIWYAASTKLVSLQHQKLNQSAASIHNNTDQTFSKMKRIQFVSAIYLIINSQIAYTVVWISVYASYLTIFVLSALSVLAILEPLKVFLSSTILVRNYSLISNNNTREISDPKFKIELLIDLIHQFVVLLLISLFGFNSGHHITIFFAIYWLSFTNAVESLKKCYNKYSNWITLQKRLNEVFPIVERSEDEPEELCSICHENILIARKLPCGHIFHLKCLVYWLDNQKSCPNCRANMGNLNELIGNNRQESTVSRIFNQAIAPIRSFFSRA